MKELWDLYKSGAYTDFDLRINDDVFKLHKKIIKGNGSKFIDNLLSNELHMNFFLVHGHQPIDKSIIECIIHYIYDNNITIETNITNQTDLDQFKKVINFFELGYCLDNFTKLFDSIPTDCFSVIFARNEFNSIMKFIESCPCTTESVTFKISDEPNYYL